MRRRLAAPASLDPIGAAVLLGRKPRLELRRRLRKITPQAVVVVARKRELVADAIETSNFHLGEAGDCFRPTERLFDQLAFSLAQPIAVVPRRSAVDGRSSLCPNSRNRRRRFLSTCPVRSSIRLVPTTSASMRSGTTSNSTMSLRSNGPDRCLRLLRTCVIAQAARRYQRVCPHRLLIGLSPPTRAIGKNQMTIRYLRNVSE